MMFRDGFEYIQVVFFVFLFLEEVGENDGFGNYEYLEVVVIVVFVDF